MIELIQVPSGTFLMGSPETEEGRFDDEGPQHLVTVPSFLMGKYPVTQAQWREVAVLPRVEIELNLDSSRFKGSNRPVERVSWYDAVEFCARLSRETGQIYRLPSEAEWEYACRAGTTTAYSFGDAISKRQANFDSSGTTEVGLYPANAFGLHDMHGNVWEWCADCWHDNYQGAPTDGSVWIGEDYRILRGGSWFNFPWASCRSACRNGNDPGVRNNADGFRVVCEVPRTL